MVTVAISDTVGISLETLTAFVPPAVSGLALILCPRINRAEYFRGRSSTKITKVIARNRVSQAPELRGGSALARCGKRPEVLVKRRRVLKERRVPSLTDDHNLRVRQCGLVPLGGGQFDDGIRVSMHNQCRGVNARHNVVIVKRAREQTLADVSGYRHVVLQ